MKINKKKFGKLIVQYRHQTYVNFTTQQELAEILEISAGSLCYIEKDRNLPSAQAILAFYVSTSFPILDALKEASE